MSKELDRIQEICLPNIIKEAKETCGKVVYINAHPAIVYPNNRVKLNDSYYAKCDKCGEGIQIMGPLGYPHRPIYHDCRPWWKIWEKQGMYREEVT